jgi:hypothetical protein
LTVKIVWPVKTECPFQGTFSLWHRKSSVDHSKHRWMISYDRVTMYREIPLENIDFVLAFINTQTFQNEELMFKKSSVSKNGLFPLTNTLICFYSFFMIYHIIWVEENKKYSMRTIIAYFIQIFKMSLGRDIRLLRANINSWRSIKLTDGS